LARRSRLSSGRHVLTAYDRYSPSPSPNLGVGHSYPLTEAHAGLNALDCSPCDGYCSPEWHLVRPRFPLHRLPVLAPFSRPRLRHCVLKVIPILSGYLDHPNSPRNPGLSRLHRLRHRGREQRRPCPARADNPPTPDPDHSSLIHWPRCSGNSSCGSLN
jgi:hypothetical protein